MNRLTAISKRLAGTTTGQTEKRSEPLFDMLTGTWYGTQPTRAATVGYDAAQTHGAVYACVDLLVRIVAWQMPAMTGDQPTTHPVVTNPHPEPQLSAQHWRAQALQSAMLRGYACGLVTNVGPTGFPTKILPLHPDQVDWWDNRGRWEWRVDGRGADLWQTGGNLWVAPAPRVAPGQPVGMSVLKYAAQKINLGLSATKFGGDFFDSGGLPVAHGKVTDQTNLNETVARALKQRLLDVTRNREPLITGSNFDLTTIPVNADESQFLETIGANESSVCMFFGVPPETIGSSSGDSMTYSNVEGRNLALLTNTVGAWMTWFEVLFSDLLPPGQRITLDPEALLRTSVPTLFNTAQVGFASGILTRTEARAMIGYGVDEGAQSGLSARELAEAIQKIYLGVGKVIDATEAREILNREGAGLSIPGPFPDGGQPE